MLRIAVLLLAALVFAPAASAQWDPGASADLGQGYGMNALSQSVMTNTFNTTGRPRTKAKAKKPRTPTRAQRAKLRFTPTAERTAANVPAITAVLLASCPPERAGCPVEHASIIADHLAENRTRFRDNVRTLVRGSDRNLADAVATFVVMAWLAQRPTLELTAAQKQGARRTGTALRDQLALQAPVRRLPAAKKQRLVELLGAIAQHTLALRQAYVELGHPDEAEQLTRYLREVTEKLTAVDVTTLRLTRKGFARR
jgi:hypothetical protein